MDLSHTDEQTMLRDTVRAFVLDKAPLTSVREWMETEAGHDAGLWASMAEMGLPAMHVPEEYGGAGFSYRELGIVMEELGRGLVPSPMFATVVLGANLVMLAGTESQRTALLPSVAMGETTLAVAVVEKGGSWDAADISTTISHDGDELVVSGAKSYVVDGHTADVLIVAGMDAGGRIRFVRTPADTPGLSVTPVESMDMTRKLADVTFDDVRVPASAELTGSDSATLERLRDLAAVALAYEAVGAADVVMEAAVDYAKTRHQFGRPIGSFQAVKHACADMLVAVEAARSSAYAAGWAVDNDDEELAVLAPLAHSVCADAFFDVSASNIQVHGGIGFTWEHDAHLYFKRARSSQLLLGSPGEWRSVLADRIGV
jgi:alkylation response protein AidB-like acyl-CoA dehydrogenase